MSADGAGARAGSLADEAGRLFEALQQVAGSWSRAGGEGDACEHGAPSTCRICPVCQVLSRLEAVRPEAVQHLAEAASALIAAFGELAAGRAPSRDASTARPGSPGAPAPDVQHIDITD